MSGVRGNTNSLFGGQNASVGNYLSNYSNAINSQETVPAMWQRLSNETGYNSANQQAINLNNQLNYLPQTETAAMKGFDVNNNQLNTDIGLQQWKLAPLAARASSNATNIAQNIMNPQIAATQAQQQKELTPYTTEGAFLTDYLTRQTTSFTTENEQEMNALIAKQAQGVILTTNEQDNLTNLKTAQIAYNQAVDSAKITAQGGITSQQIAQQYQTLNPNQTLYNTSSLKPGQSWTP
jgi:replicative DNA helicase